MLKRIKNELVGMHSNLRNCTNLWGDCSNLRGNCSDLRGNCSNLSGHCSNLRGNCSNLRGNCSNLWGDCTNLWEDDYNRGCGAFVPRAMPRLDRLKRCRACDEWFPIVCFNRRKNSPDGHATECRACKSERRKNGSKRYSDKRTKPQCTSDHTNSVPADQSQLCSGPNDRSCS